MFEINKDPSDSDLRGYGIGMLVGFSVLAVVSGVLLPLWSSWRSGDLAEFAWKFGAKQQVAVAMASTGLALFVLSKVSLAGTRVVYLAWMSVFMPVGRVMTAVLMTLLFLLLLPVFSVVARLKDPLQTTLKSEGTYWEPTTQHEPTLERMARQFEDVCMGVTQRDAQHPDGRSTARPIETKT